MGKKCTHCGAGPFPDDELRCRGCNKHLPSQVQHNLRPNAGAAIAVPPPTHMPDSRPLWTGSRAQLGSFSDNFTTQFLNDVYVVGVWHKHPPVRMLHRKTRKHAGVPFYECVRCGDMVPRAAYKHQQDDGKYITIDHIEDIRDFVIGHTDAQACEIGAHTWDVYLLADAQATHRTWDNLQPMCNVCNSRKNGNRDLDGDVRNHRLDCAGCQQPLPAGSRVMRSRTGYGTNPNPYARYSSRFKPK